MINTTQRMTHEQKVFYQRLLRANGFYLGKIDGVWGPQTEMAHWSFENSTDKLRNHYGEFDYRTETGITWLQIKTQEHARKFMNGVELISLAMKFGTVRIICGLRTYEEQAALYREGRYGNPGPRITNAKAGQSFHNFGLAFDIGIFDVNGGYVTDEGPYYEIGKTIRTPLEWGGSWRESFVDLPHYQMVLGIPLSEYRKEFER